MELRKVDERGALVTLSPDELLTISNALNEVCNGLDIAEFATRMGVQREDAQRLLATVSTIHDQAVQHAG